MITLVGYILFLVAMFFAWAIGGEQYFGKCRRGFLLAIPMTILGLLTLPWYLLIVQIGVLWGVYQSLKYDPGINLVYSQGGNYGWAMGWGIIVVNGAVIGLTALCFMIDRRSIFLAILAEIGAILGFVAAVMLSNEDRFKSYRDWLSTHMPPHKVYLKYISLNFQDAWYVSEGIVGLIIGVIILCLR